MLYGANGYTGRLTAEAAHQVGMRPVLAGRREQAIRPLAERLELDYEVFPLESVRTIADRLDGMAAILLAAGPFSTTSRPVLEAAPLHAHLPMYGAKASLNVSVAFGVAAYALVGRAGVQPGDK